MELAEIRDRIDSIDKEILRLFLERMECSDAAARIKSESGIAVINSAREEEIIAGIAERSGDMSAYTSKLFRAVLELSRERQSELIDSDYRDSDIWRELAFVRENVPDIVLIGMPGAGKTTIAGILGRMTGRKVIETDDLIEEETGRSVQEIIESDGEKAFRRLETEAVKTASYNSGVIIATGGGAVTVPDNYIPLHMCGIIYHLERDTRLLPVQGRPLSTDLEAMYRQRRHMYLSFRDRTADNNGSPEDCAARIWEDYLETAQRRRF
ncbi:MAG: chorismate mutase [Oscillospiraceae bacterium]|nr:chorismate mutase [Oscillospiraceae bacterium]